MVSYKELGLVNTRDMFAKAVAGGYAIPAFNFNNMEQLQAIVMAAAETKSPVILQVSKGARKYANATLLRYMAEGAVAYAKELGWENPQIVLHLDHGDSFETCKDCVDSGFSSVMIDASALPYEENIALTKKVVDYAHQFDVTVEVIEAGARGGKTAGDHHRKDDIALLIHPGVFGGVLVEAARLELEADRRFVDEIIHPDGDQRREKDTKEIYEKLAKADVHDEKYAAELEKFNAMKTSMLPSKRRT